MTFIKATLIDFGLAAVFAIAALLMLGEYRLLLKTDPKAALSVEALKRIILSSGFTGYFALFLLAASVLTLCVGVIILLLNIAPFLNLLN
ncbi:MAG: hypothetical protein WA635_13240 [Gallionella sp.]